MPDTEPDTPHALAESRGVSNPLVLLQSMIERGTDPDALKKMMDLAERWQANRAEESYWTAFNLAQAEMPNVFKSRKGQHSSYAPYEDMLATIRPIYTRHGFSMTFTEDVGAREGHIRICCDVAHREGHVRRHVGDYPLDGEGAKGGRAGMNAIQATGSTHSYAKRYIAKDVWNLAESNEDNDGQTYCANGHMVAINTMLESISKAEAEATAKGIVIPKPFDLQALLAWIEAPSVGEILLSKFDTLMKQLERKLKAVPR